ncbi:sensor histidine kinase [Flavobacterium selenitireducens]|uniref:sensor histidine kinase n=1 Tax=Flavobacterium selenitireducens TaxID=2722704 RepID=UPI00168A7671|nr:sensor histidine kinase [Flavobacterium selenitireducens]MBD3582268.1 histidine kinase [Flavobacterium selenitireducens]
MNTRINSILDSKWWQEIAIFGFMLTIHLLKNDWIEYASGESVLAALSYFGMLYVHAQINRFFLLPILLKQHKPLAYIGFSLALIGVFTIVIYEVAENFLPRLDNYPCYQRGFIYQMASLSGTLILYLGPTVMLKLYREQKRQQDAELLFNQMQLKALRSQLNPHFLFNTFNTLYGISLQYPERTSDLIMKMSQLLRYQIESDQRQYVTLEEEIEFVSSYIELERERLGYRCNIQFDYRTDSENGYKISPMLLINFIENAFKHGTGTIGSCFVNLSVTVKEGLMDFRLENSIPEKKSTVVSTKIGIKNTTERLKLLYHDKHDLTIEEPGDKFVVSLKLRLKKIASCLPSDCV